MVVVAAGGEARCAPTSKGWDTSTPSIPPTVPAARSIATARYPAGGAAAGAAGASGTPGCSCPAILEFTPWECWVGWVSTSSGNRGV